MRKYTQEEFDQFPVDEFGRKRCPTGDYTLIEAFPGRGFFGDGCTFGKLCLFGESCYFGHGCTFGWYCSFSK